MMYNNHESQSEVTRNLRAPQLSSLDAETKVLRVQVETKNQFQSRLAGSEALSSSTVQLTPKQREAARMMGELPAFKNEQDRLAHVARVNYERSQAGICVDMVMNPDRY